MSSCGTRQGDPLGAQFFALGLHPILCALAALVGHRGVVIAYADDIHILAPPSVIAEVIPCLVAQTDPSPPAGVLPPASPRLRSAGLVPSPGKASIYSPLLSQPAFREATAATLRCVTDALGDPSRTPGQRSAALLRGEGSSVAAGHPVLGTPLGTDAFISASVSATLARSSALLDGLRLLLTSRQGTTVFAPDEFDLLLRFCVWSRPRHLMRTLPPGPVTDLLTAFQATVVDAHLESIPSADLATALLIDPRALCQLPGRFGGHGVMPYGPGAAPGAAGPEASYHDAAWYGSWLAVWHYMRAWIPHLHGRQLAHTGQPGAAFAYQVSVAGSWDRIARAHTLVSAHHDHASLLPPNSDFPTIHSRFTDGRLSPATAPLGQAPAVALDDDADSPSILHDLDCADVTCHPHAHRAASAVVASLAFLALYDASRPAGRARLLDGSIARGPFSFWRRIPVPSPSPSPTAPPLFAFTDASEFSVALAIDLLVRPPVGSTDGTPAGTGCTFCARCAPSVPDASISPVSRHFTTCAHGVRLSSTCHDPVVAVLGRICSAVLGPARVRVDATRARVDGEAAQDRGMGAFMQAEGAGLPHIPDLVLEGFDGPGTFTLLEVKTFDPCGATHMGAQHTDRDRGAAHAHVVAQSRRVDYRLPDQPLPPRMRLVVISVSVAGAIGSAGQAFLRELGRRSSQHVPSLLSPESTWAAPRMAPFARMAIVMAVRRGLARAVIRDWDRTAAYPHAPPPPMAAALPALPMPAPLPGMALVAPVAVPVGLFG